MAGTTTTSADLTAIATDPAIAPMIKSLPPQHRANFLKAVGGAAARHAKRKTGGYQMPHRTETDMPAGRTRLWNSYYSVLRFQATVSVAAPVTTLTFNAGMELRAFSYRINDPLTSAGFDPTVG